MLLLLMAAVQGLFAQYTIVPAKSAISFSIKNFGIAVGGTLTGPEGNINFDASHPEQAMFIVTIKAASINTGNDLRDEHLKKETYFDTGHYPLISFISTRVVKDTKGALTVYGTLTIKNHSKEAAILFTVTANGDGYLFEGQFTVNRKDFDIGGASIIADTASISLSVHASK